MTSVVDICNMALSRCGNSKRINSLDEATTGAEQCSLFYEQSRDFVLRAYSWGFATAFSTLARLSANPDPQFAYAYAEPTDCLKIRRLVDKAWNLGLICSTTEAPPQIPAIPFRVVNGSSNRVITTNVEEATLEYTVKIKNPELFDPIFVSALAWYLAAQIAPALAKDAGIAQNCDAEYRSQIAIAEAADLNEGQLCVMSESSFVTVRG